MYHKSELLYGYDRAKHGIRALGFWLIVEGQFDVVMSHQAGYTNTVAVSGTAFTEHHAQLLERLSSKVVLALDADKAGIAAMKRAAELLLKRGIDVKVAAMPDGADPADMVLSDVKSFKTAIGHSVHIIEFLLAHLRKTITDDRTFKLRAREEVIPFVTLIPNRIDQEHFIGKIAEALGTTKDAVQFEVGRLSEEKKLVTPAAASVIASPAAPIPATPVLRKDNTFQYLLAALTVTVPEVQSILERELRVIVGEEEIIKEQTSAAPAITKLAFQIESFIEKNSARLQIEEWVYKLNQLREILVKEKITAARNELNQLAETGGDVTEVLTRVQQLQKDLQIPPYTPELFTQK